MSESRREKLVGIQKREQLKGLLTNKFKLKYGAKAMPMINNEVGKFLNNERLTEENLRKLDDKIGREAELREKKEDVLSDHRSVKSGKSSRPRTTASNGSRRKSALQNAGVGAVVGGAPNMDDAISVKSYASSRMSGASNLSRRSGASKKKAMIGADGRSQASDLDTVSQVSRPQSQFSHLNEDDEWTAIMNFNTVLHFEEQKQAMLREQERKRLIKEELDRQVRDKNARKRREQDEDNLYDNLQQKHLQLLDEKEKERQAEIGAKINREKNSRDQQLKEEKRRKRHEERDEMAQEQAIVTKLKDEMNQERQMLLEKRAQERDYLQRMLEENEKHKANMKQQEERERLQDVAAQDAYTKMLEQQEKDRLNEIDRREQRAQEFMGRMADTVLKEMDMKQKEEEDKIKRFEMEKEQQDRFNERLEYKRMKDDQQKLRDDLARQVAEKKRRENMEKEFNDEQAKMWQLDRQNYEQQENLLNGKIQEKNRENRAFLESQMAERNAAKASRMNYNEHLLNKALLRDINYQRKTGSSHHGSAHGSAHGGSVRGGSQIGH